MDAQEVGHNLRSTAPPGNTSAGGVSRKRGFILTVNEAALPKYAQIKDYLLHWNSNNYYLAVEHIGSENKHYHIYVQYSCPVKMKYECLLGAHCEATYGTPQECVRYLKCEDKKHVEEGVHAEVIEEIGELRKSGGRTIKAVMEMTPEERMDLPIQYANIVDKINSKQKSEESFQQMLDEIRNDDLKAPEVVYINGASGRGKTYGAYKLAMNKYENKDIGRITIQNGFFTFDNENAKCFVIEEFRPSELHACEFLQLTDKYGYNCNVKGGHHYIRPEMLIICSIIDVDEIYKEEINQQFKRRITKYFTMEDEHQMVEGDLSLSF